MHSYLKSVGFSKIKRRSELQELIRDVMEDYDEKTVVHTLEFLLFDKSKYINDLSNELELLSMLSTLIREKFEIKYISERKIP